MSPRLLFRRLAAAEAVTWSLLLVGMFLKYVTETTDARSASSGCCTAWSSWRTASPRSWSAIDQRWGLARILLGLASAVPPLATLPFERYADRRGLLGDTWRLRALGPTGSTAPTGLERPVAWLVRHPGRGLLTGLAAVVALDRRRAGGRPAGRLTPPRPVPGRVQLRLPACSLRQVAALTTPEALIPTRFCQSLTAFSTAAP